MQKPTEKPTGEVGIYFKDYDTGNFVFMNFPKGNADLIDLLVLAGWPKEDNGPQRFPHLRKMAKKFYKNYLDQFPPDY